MTKPVNALARLNLIQPLVTCAQAVAEGIDPVLGELIKIRASQINGCAVCLHMHVAEARKMGLTDARIHMLAGWREAFQFDARERAVLAWTEALTLLPARPADGLLEEMQQHFSEEEIIRMTLMIGAINAFNRLNVGLRAEIPEAWRKAA